MSTAMITTPRITRPVMRPVNYVPRSAPTAPVPVAPARLRRVVSTVFTVAASAALAVLVLGGISNLGQALESFTAPTVGVIQNQYVPSSERPAVVQVKADPATTVRSAG